MNQISKSFVLWSWSLAAIPAQSGQALEKGSLTSEGYSLLDILRWLTEARTHEIVPRLCS